MQPNYKIIEKFMFQNEILVASSYQPFWLIYVFFID